ncbi:MAG: TetR-like C-terminal domain-containing protein, partial [Lachnospiraceae bacterium]|nr:TetR-like C-terminal domain-containing protein [Lachnospiraceae bacterium]
MISNPTDRRVQRTQKNIRNALISLLSEKELSQITVKELSDKADINRKTFYSYYSGIDDILDKIEDEIVEKLLAIIRDYDFRSSDFYAYALFCSLNQIINDDFELYQSLIFSNNYDFLLIKVKNTIKKTLLERYAPKINAQNNLLGLYAEYVASGIVSMYIEWFHSDNSVSLEELAK